jgi:hypothetical protein
MFELGRLSLGIAGLAVFLRTFGLTVGADLLEILCVLYGRLPLFI